jgi:hypothetical protein
MRDFCIGKIHLFVRDHEPQYEIDQQSRYAAWDERQDESQPEPKGTDTEEFGKSATDSSYHTVTP